MANESKTDDRDLDLEDSEITQKDLDEELATYNREYFFQNTDEEETEARQYRREQDNLFFRIHSTLR